MDDTGIATFYQSWSLDKVLIYFFKPRWDCCLYETNK